MQVEYVKISSLDEVDVSTLYEASASVIDQSYIWWPAGVTSPEQKKEHYIAVLKAAFNKMISVGDYDVNSLFAFKATIDGVDSLLNVGYVKDNCYASYWYLTSPDASGSRNWLFASKNIMHAFYKNSGFNSFKFVTYEGSLLLRNTRMRHNSGHIVILNENKIDDFHIEVIVKVNDVSVLTA